MKEHNSTILRTGEKIHVIHRQRFEKDARRHFVGEVQCYEQGMARASGYVFVVDDLNKHMFVKPPDRRINVVAERRDHTIRAAIAKAVAHIEAKLGDRARKPLRRLRSNLQPPAPLRERRMLS